MILPEVAVGRRAAEVVLPQASPENEFVTNISETFYRHLFYTPAPAEPGGSPVVQVKQQVIRR